MRACNQKLTLHISALVVTFMLFSSCSGQSDDAYDVFRSAKEYDDLGDVISADSLYNAASYLALNRILDGYEDISNSNYESESDFRPTLYNIAYNDAIYALSQYRRAEIYFAINSYDEAYRSIEESYNKVHHLDLMKILDLWSHSYADGIFDDVSRSVKEYSEYKGKIDSLKAKYDLVRALRSYVQYFNARDFIKLVRLLPDCIKTIQPERNLAESIASTLESGYFLATIDTCYIIDVMYYKKYARIIANTRIVVSSKEGYENAIDLSESLRLAYGDRSKIERSGEGQYTVETVQVFFGLAEHGEWGLLQATASQALFSCIPRDVVSRLLPRDYDKGNEKNEPQLYRDPVEGFQIELPAGWTVRESSMEKTLIKCVQKGDGRNLSVIAVAKYPNATVENMWDVDRSEMVQSIAFDLNDGRPSVLAYDKLELSGLHATRTYATLRMLDQDMETVAYHVIRNGNQYRISGTAKGDHGYVEYMLKVMEVSLLSFTFN